MNLDTTNLLLGIMAAVSVIEAIALVVGGVLLFRMYAEAMRTIRELESRHVMPLVARADALMTKAEGVLGDARGVLGDVKGVTERMPGQSRLGNLVTLASGAKQILGGIFNGRRSSGEAPGMTQREDQHGG